MLTGQTTVAGVIGSPVGQSLSPVLHNAAYQALGIDWIYVAFPVDPGGASGAITAMRQLGIAGLSVTMPHKAAAAAAVDRLSHRAQLLGSINTVSRRATTLPGVELLGESTDGEGFVEALRADHGWVPDGRRCVVLGAGGAARAITLALVEAGAAHVVVVARNSDAAERCATLGGPVGESGSVEAAADADLVVNATPVGMNGGGEHPLALPLGLNEALLGSGQLVADLVYSPLLTPLLAAAARRGAKPVDGVGMLVHQAAAQIRCWTGLEPPIPVMVAAIEEVLSTRG